MVKRRGGSGGCVNESWWKPVIAATGERRLRDKLKEQRVEQSVFHGHFMQYDLTA